MNMNFGEEKCAYMRIEKGKMVDSSNPIVMNNLTIKPILSGDNYCYLGIDEILLIVVPLTLCMSMMDICHGKCLLYAMRFLFSVSIMYIYVMKVTF